jgi:4-carboxymuconolactone decarboxylase
MDDQKRRDDGMAQRRKVLGDAWVDKSIANKNSFNAEFIDLITRHAWGEIWTRPHFDQRTRRVLVIGTMAALGQWEEFRARGTQRRRLHARRYQGNPAAAGDLLRGARG